MKVLSKEGDEMQILALPGESFFRGEYLKIEDNIQNTSMIVQVYDSSYLDSPGVQEDLLRDELFSSSSLVKQDPLQVESLGRMIKDARILKCKIRGIINGGEKMNDSGWLPSRSSSVIRRVSIDELYSLMHLQGQRRIRLGNSIAGEDFFVNAEELDGRLNIITGRKEAGKSHLAKLLVAGLLDYGAKLVIFDLNGEYSGIALDKSGMPSRYAKKIKVLQPGYNLKFGLRYLGKRIMVDLLQHTLEVPGATLREFMRIWDYLEQSGRVTLKDMEDAIMHWHCNEFVKDALLSRFYSLLSSDLISDNPRYCMTLEDEFSKMEEGGAIVVALGDSAPLSRRMIVEVILAKLIESLEHKVIEPVFLFAEEAHLYLRHTYWEDLITRMRHFGVFSTFVTNQPDAIGSDIYRQADNIFLYNFTNEKDIEMVAQASMTDFETVKSIVRSLQPRSCLVLGKVVGDLPVVIRTLEADFQSMGRTRLFFSRNVAEARA
ncbi:MAG: DUF87 domain-containing protein [Conexivisphaerales archaeon]